ncbi:peptidase [Streptomyces sp. A0958]|uniref:peptidase n=1 Tax=Streptomyces sp. A0958 TaxID=2563101 RepID=UPI00109E74F1|nr:peptidase [Streptomyces sp. A0958]THA69208.1 peptidase [Streptomyces sp. A0958]
MRSTTPRAAFRRFAGVVASAGLLAAGTLALGGPARAAVPEFTLGGPADTALHPYPATGTPQKATLGLTVTNPSEDEENGVLDGEYTVRFDFSKLAGVADVSFGEDGGLDCERTGTTAVCHDYGIWPGLSTLAELDVSAAEGSEDGDTGTLAVTAEAEGATFRAFTARVSIGGPDLSMKRLPLRTELKPGDSQPVPITFTNNGTRAAQGVLLTLRNTRGMEFTERYQNCEYSEDDLGFGSPGAWSTALCTFPGSYEPGATYTLAEPPVIRATERAYYDSFLYRVAEDGTDARASLRAGARFSPGKGAALALRKSPAVRSADLDPDDNQQDVDFHTANSADFAAYGDKARGAAGDTVDVTVGFRNRGPAWIGYIRSGEDVATVDITVPEGASVLSGPATCRGVTKDGQYRENQKAAPRYFCSTPMSVREDADFALPFRLKIDKVVAGASGNVVVRNTFLQDPALPFDPKPANNTASLVLNGEDPGATTGGSTSGGSTATGGSTGGSGDTGATGSASAGSSSTGTTGTTGTTGSGSGDGTGGALASTGTVALTASGAALVALLAGGALFTVARRRATR